MPPKGPDGAQGGRSTSEEPASRSVGEASDKVSETEGEAPETAAKAKPARGSVAPAPKTDAKAQSGKKSGSSGPGIKPETLTEPRASGADDLKLIKGIGPKLETQLNSMGFFHFDQIAKWGQDEVAWVDQNLEGFKGRASRDNWVDQSQKLARGG